MAATWTWLPTGEPLYVSTAAGTLTLGLGGHTNLSFDGEGRPVGAWLDGHTYRRGLDNRVLEKWLDGEQRRRRHRRLMDAAARRALLDRVLGLAGDISHGLARGRVRTGDDGLRGAVTDWLGRVTRWGWASLEAESARYHGIYKPVSILPPDQYLAVVVQATEGCSYNGCTFCTFYRDRPFRIKPPAELADHVARVKGFLGRGLAMRRTLFLADANAVIIAQSRLLPILETVEATFDLAAAGAGRPPLASAGALAGIYAFVSAPDALHKTAADFAAMRARGVRRLYIGLESGHDPLRAFIRKQGRADDVLAAVRAIKDGGVSVGIIVLVGVGGQAFRTAHFQDTVALIQRLPLTADDLVYLSPYVADPAAPYARDAAEADIVPLSDEELCDEELRCKAALQPWARGRGVRISHYDVREFIY